MIRPKYDKLIDFTDNDKCMNFYKQLNNAGYYGDQVCYNHADNAEFFNEQIGSSNINKARESYHMFNSTSIGNLGLFVAYANDITIKKQSYDVIEDYFNYMSRPCILL
jgi:hypothetical protein